MILTAIDKGSDLWRKLKEHYESRRQEHRVANDNGRLTDLETARLRGRIAELGDLLDLDTPTEQSPGINRPADF
jgi:hypothetical protein